MLDRSQATPNKLRDNCDGKDHYRKNQRRRMAKGLPFKAQPDTSQEEWNQKLRYSLRHVMDTMRQGASHGQSRQKRSNDRSDTSFFRQGGQPEEQNHRDSKLPLANPHAPV